MAFNGNGCKKDMKLPVSAIVLTYNEEKKIEECLRSLEGWVDEIFIVDSFSSDRTVEMSRRYTRHIYQHPFENYGIQRNWAQANLPIRNEWIFHLDADERVMPELINALKGKFRYNLSPIDGYLISRQTVFMGRWIKHGGHYPAYHLRIFRKHSGRCEDRLYDQHFIVNGNLAILDGDIIDTVTSDIGRWFKGLKRWAILEALEATRHPEGLQLAAKKHGNCLEKKRWLRQRYYKLPIFVRPILYFLYRYFFKCGFLDGIKGLLFHAVQGLWYRWLVDRHIFFIWAARKYHRIMKLSSA